MKIGKFLLGIFIIIALFIIFGNRGFTDYRMLKEKQAVLEETNKCIAAENDELKRKIVLLKTDLRHIETVARKELGMVKKGDMVYQFID
ncbi:MAG: septum formation initiator family protein [Deltaproteobacteria bacterium]|nr:septum formation initiator family protein [Deltaproteobacteria bacterium]